MAFRKEGYGTERPSCLTVTEAYDRKAASGAITPDPAQRTVAAEFDHLLSALSERNLAAKGSALGWLFGARRKSVPAPRGLYLWGGVGRGKTMLMDLFFAAAPVAKKRRQHFHLFMRDAHERVFAARQEIAAGADRDPVDLVAERMAREIELLCFDEFSVTDIADAMILGRLFADLFHRGLVLVATSNVEPDQLYHDGINRGHFLPFIALLNRHAKIVHLGAATDYRLQKLQKTKVYLTPLTQESEAAMNDLWMHLTGTERGRESVLEIKGRRVVVPQAAEGVARFSFTDLCEQPLGAHDYLAIASRYHTVFLDHVPRLTFERRNEAKRFITLIDSFYDAGVKLILSAAGEPASLYQARSGAEAFEFGRTVSRLMEMRSEAYLSTPRRDGDERSK